ncbi:RNA-directed DNA polymerase, eukaryota, reverse transcriptase zinc-binding domain protein [Tanacetum coccineum]|uniref:RNA-directed DNA polymerase, eukaryota, reverse transcriptase zinc-binding domain protein n=1 Tax=Tanacetum coccineum TaxID=301880 RepID=A0ABQ5C133_9ASTR
MDTEQRDKESLKRSGETLQGAEKKKQKVLDVEDIPIPESAKFVKEEEIEIKQPVLKMSRRKSKARKGIGLHTSTEPESEKVEYDNIKELIKSVLNSIVDKNQSAFILERQIIDNILLTQELLKGYHCVKGPKRCSMKIDIQKAYATVDWRFLENALNLFGFHHKMVTWIMACVSTPSYSICENGERHWFFKGGRGLRQGDPMSPYLFTIVMEVFNLILQQIIKEDNSFKYHHGCKILKITHLCFADDLLVLCHGDVNSVKVINKAIDKFSCVSGLFPNLGKRDLQRRKAKVSWKEVCQPKQYGGLGFKSLDQWNQALLVKHLWNVVAKKDSL